MLSELGPSAACPLVNAPDQWSVEYENPIADCPKQQRRRSESATPEEGRQRNLTPDTTASSEGLALYTNLLGNIGTSSQPRFHDPTENRQAQPATLSSIPGLFSSTSKR
jgi:hypothetical protein